jgi:hypothetical protein
LFIVGDIKDYMKSTPLFVDIFHIMICKNFIRRNKLNNELGIFMYLSMIDGHIIFVELESNDFNDLTSFNTNVIEMC